MASANVHVLTDANFKAEVIDSQQPVLVDFWAEWCQPCLRLIPTIDALADEYKGRVKVGKVDVDANRAVSVQCAIQAMPTLLVFKGGQVVKKFVGLRQKQELADALNEVLAGS